MQFDCGNIAIFHHVLLLALWWNHIQNVIQIYFRLKWQKHSFLGFPGTRKIYKLHCKLANFLWSTYSHLTSKQKRRKKKFFFSIRFTLLSTGDMWNAKKEMLLLKNNGCNYPVPSASSETRSFAIDLQEIRFHFSPKATNGQKHPCWQAHWKT